MTQVKSAAVAVAKNTTPTNGKTTPTDLKAVKTDNPTTDGEKTSVPMLHTKEENIVLNFEDTQHRLNQLWDLQSKYNRLQASKLKLKEFNFTGAKSDEFSLSINKGYREIEFSTKNADLIKEMVNYLVGVIDAKITTLEKQIRW